jgi:hypothetical protein
MHAGVMATYNDKQISIREWIPHYQQPAGIPPEVQQRFDDETKARGILPPSLDVPIFLLTSIFL